MGVPNSQLTTIFRPIYFYKIFRKNFPKTVKKKPHRFHVFVAYMNACLRDQFNMRHRANI